MSEKLTPERAVYLLRAKAAELEARVLSDSAFDPQIELGGPYRGTKPNPEVTQLAADIALVAQLLADHIERTEPPPLPLATQQRLAIQEIDENDQGDVW